jgi:DNA topoisomerase-1
MEVESLDFETALKLLSLPRALGTSEETNEPIIAHNGRFGPYVQCGKETRSLPAEISPLEVSLEQALELLSKPKQYGRGARGGTPAKKAEPLRVFEDSPVTEKPINVLNGRFGIYITDGETNATLPRDLSAEELTFEKALDLLAARAAKGGTKKKATRKKATAKKVAKKAVKKAAKKAAKKTSKKVVKK